MKNPSILSCVRIVRKDNPNSTTIRKIGPSLLRGFASDSACVVPCCLPKLMLESRTTRILEGENDTSQASTFDPFREPFKEEDVVALCSSSRRPAPKPPWLTYVI